MPIRIPDVPDATQEEDRLAVIDISRRNPLEIVFSGMSIAMTVAVIISGGKLDMTKLGMKVSLPPLGKGVAEPKKGRQESTRPDDANEIKQFQRARPGADCHQEAVLR